MKTSSNRQVISRLAQVHGNDEGPLAMSRDDSLSEGCLCSLLRFRYILTSIILEQSPIIAVPGKFPYFRRKRVGKRIESENCRASMRRNLFIVTVRRINKCVSFESPLDVAFPDDRHHKFEKRQLLNQDSFVLLPSLAIVIASDQEQP